MANIAILLYLIALSYQLLEFKCDLAKNIYDSANPNTTLDCTIKAVTTEPLSGHKFRYYIIVHDAAPVLEKYAEDMVDGQAYCTSIYQNDNDGFLRPIKPL